MIQTGSFVSQIPLVASHEGAGTVVAAGSSSPLRPGDRVMCGIPFRPCGECPDCAGPEEGWRQFCVRVEGHIGLLNDGYFAEYVLCDARSAARVPDEVSLLSAAPLACAGRTVWRGVEQTGLVEGQWVAIVGSGGGLGHLGVQFAKKKGLRVVGIDARDDGLELSREMGADVVVDARKGKDEVVRLVQEATREANPGHPGVDATVTVSGAQGAAGLSCAVTKMHGTVVHIAVPDGDNIVIPSSELVFRDIRVKGGCVASPRETDNMLKFIAEKAIEIKKTVYDGLDKIEELLELVHSGKMQGKGVIVVDQNQIETEKKLGAKY